jgi:hypothetical protein
MILGNPNLVTQPRWVWGWQALSLTIALVAGGGPTMAVETEMVGRLSLFISTDKPVYKVGEPIVLSLRLVNGTQDEVRLEFNDSQRYDFVIRDPAGKEVWRWSRDQFFAQVIGSEIVGPARPQLEFQTRFSGALDQGVYRIEGTLPARGHRLSATLTVQVR